MFAKFGFIAGTSIGLTITAYPLMKIPQDFINTSIQQFIVLCQTLCLVPTKARAVRLSGAVYNSATMTRLIIAAYNFNSIG